MTFALPFRDPICRLLARIRRRIASARRMIFRLKPVRLKPAWFQPARLPLWVLGIGVGCITLALILVLVLPKGRRSTPVIRPGAITESFKPLPIPAEELFLPDEPNFLPNIVLEREPRPVWTPDDARPFWIDPLADGPDAWRAGMKQAIDELLEGVP